MIAADPSVEPPSITKYSIANDPSCERTLSIVSGRYAAWLYDGVTIVNRIAAVFISLNCHAPAHRVATGVLYFGRLYTLSLWRHRRTESGE